MIVYERTYRRYAKTKFCPFCSSKMRTRQRHRCNPFNSDPPSFDDFFKNHPHLKPAKKVTLGEKFMKLQPRQKQIHAMKEYLGLDLLMPSWHMLSDVSTVWDMLLWAEDILQFSFGSEKKSFRVLDVGTNSSCFFAILGAKLFNWNFVCVRTDEANFIQTMKNVENNGLTSAIQGK